ncbi:MAG TPA: serine/threonine-protein kinase [Bryobacteraceae bacterium]|nr:serine/threonine-protein kinase [Bryobacteraceae bacterium]
MRTFVEEVFWQVADLPVAARARFFSDHRVDDATKREVEALLEFDSQTGALLDRQIQLMARRTLDRFAASAGTRCGPYRLGHLLGRGGMGSVYAAERVDGEVTQRVAVKLLRPGSDLPQFRRWFLSERQILASLSHPHVARLLDAGHREDGQPYLVMEYVDGIAIDAFAENLSVRQKIVLFLKVCAAVGYLHRNLVVHRDLKPSNILVTPEGEPKLLDFGIARILDATGDATVTQLRMMTPEYASPEQAAGGRITTATDIYSLGAVLYKMLTGSSPRQFSDRSPAAIAASIQDGSVAPPSELVRDLRGDLEAVVLRALRPEPQERYASVEQMAGDLENFLASRPVRARSGDIWYRGRKYFRRYWLPIAAATLTVASLTIGLTIANRERVIAERRFTDVRQLANKLFDIDEQVSKLQGGIEARRLIMETSLDYLQRITADVRMDPALQLEVATAYMRVARVQWRDIQGQTQFADGTEQKAETLLDSVVAAQPANRVALLRSAEVEQDRMLIAHHPRPDDALRYAQKASARLTAYIAATQGHWDHQEAEDAILVELNVANVYAYAGCFEDSVRISRETIDLARASGWPAYIGAAESNLATAYYGAGRLDEALQAIHEAERILEPPPGNKSIGRRLALVAALIHEGKMLGEEGAINFGRPQEALQPLQRAAALADDLAQHDPDEFLSRERLFSADAIMASILRDSDPRRALELCDHALGRLAEIKDDQSARLHEVEALAVSSYPLRHMGRGDDARRRLDTAFETLRWLRVYPAETIRPGGETDAALSALADYEADRGDPLRAIEIYEELLRKTSTGDFQPQSRLGDAAEVSRLCASLQGLYGRVRRVDARATMAARRLALWRLWDQKLPHNPFVARELEAAKS